MKTPSEDVFDLIQVMSREEKQFFRQMAKNQRTGESRIELELFEAINQQEDYDEGALREMFGTRLKANQFAVVKNQLYHSLLDAFRYYSSGKGNVHRVRTLLDYVEVLFSREMYQQCRKLLEKAERIALKSDNPFLTLEVHEWRMRLWNSAHFRGVNEKDFIESNRAIRESGKSIAVYVEYLHLSNQLAFQVRTRGFLQPQHDIEAANQRLISHPMFQHPEFADSVSSKILFHWSWGFYCFMMGRNEESYRHFDAIMKFLEEEPERIHDYFSFYLSIIYAHAILALKLQDYGVADATIRKMELLETRFPLQKTRVLYYTFILRIEYFFAMPDTSPLEKHLQQGERKIPVIEKNLPTTEFLTFLLNNAGAWLALGNYKEALKWIHRLLNYPGLSSLPEFQLIAMMQHIILHFELRNFDIIPNLLRSLQRYLEKKPQHFTLESFILRYIPRAMNIQTREELKEFFLRLREELLALQEDPATRRSIQYFDFLSWIDSKIERVPFRTILMRKV